MTCDGFFWSSITAFCTVAEFHCEYCVCVSVCVYFIIFLMYDVFRDEHFHNLTFTSDLRCFICVRKFTYLSIIKHVLTVDALHCMVY